MIIENEENCMNTELLVDSWEQNYKENTKTGELELVENYIGEVPIGKTTEYKYLGFMISAKGDNMVNINAMKRKSIGIIRTLIQKLEDMKLKNYYLECAMIFLGAKAPLGLVSVGRSVTNKKVGNFKISQDLNTK